MIKPLNDNLDLKDKSALEQRLADELEERIELSCWSYCGQNCLNYA